MATAKKTSKKTAAAIAAIEDVVITKALKKTSNNKNGLTVRELESEIFKIEGVRIVIRAQSKLRTGCKKYGKRVPAVATIESLTQRLNGYFSRTDASYKLKDVEFVVITPEGHAHHNTRSKKTLLDKVRFV